MSAAELREQKLAGRRPRRLGLVLIRSAPVAHRDARFWDRGHLNARLHQRAWGGSRYAARTEEQRSRGSMSTLPCPSGKA